MSAKPIPRLTPDEYLEIERAAEYKSEYFDGFMWPLGGEPVGMAGGRYAHNLISGNIVGTLREAVEGRCDVLTGDQRIRVSPNGLYTYADASVVCGEPKVYADDTLENPCLIVEVLSESTQANDRGFKFSQYQRLPSFRGYLLVSQSEPRIEVFRRGSDGSWAMTDYRGLGAVIPLESLGRSISASEVYRRVNWKD